MTGYICGSSFGRCNSVRVCWCYGVGYVKYYEFIVRMECDFGLVLRKRVVSFRTIRFNQVNATHVLGVMMVVSGVFFGDNVSFVISVH